MDNDKVEQALNDFILNEDKKIQKLIDTLERIEKAGTLDKLFEGGLKNLPLWKSSLGGIDTIIATTSGRRSKIAG